MHVVHHLPNAPDRVLAESAEHVRTTGDRFGGLWRLVRRDGHALAFAFETVEERRATTLFTPLSLDVVWTEDGRVTAVATLEPWTGIARARGNRMFELPAGAATDVAVSDEVVVQPD